MTEKSGTLIETKLEIVVSYSDGHQETFDVLSPDPYPVALEVRKTSEFFKDADK